MADQKIKPLSKYSILDREEFERIFGFEASRSDPTLEPLYAITCISMRVF